jgi:hypothetical protein
LYERILRADESLTRADGNVVDDPIPTTRVRAARAALAREAARGNCPCGRSSCGSSPGHGLAMLPFGLPAPAAVSLVAFGLEGVIYGPYNALSFNLFQDVTPAEHITTVLAFRAALLLTATPLGTALAGPLTTVLGARQTLTGTGITMVLIAAAAAAMWQHGIHTTPDPGHLARSPTR